MNIARELRLTFRTGAAVASSFFPVHASEVREDEHLCFITKTCVAGFSMLSGTVNIF